MANCMLGGGRRKGMLLGLRMAKGWSLLAIIVIKVNIGKIRGVEMELRNSTMEMCMKDNGKITKCKEKEYISRSQVEYIIKGTGRKESSEAEE